MTAREAALQEVGQSKILGSATRFACQYRRDGHLWTNWDTEKETLAEAVKDKKRAAREGIWGELRLVSIYASVKVLEES